MVTGVGLLNIVPKTGCEEEDATIDAAAENPSTGSELDYVGVFLDADSRTKLHEYFGTSLLSQRPHVTLHFNPSNDDLKRYESVIGQDIRFGMTTLRNKMGKNIVQNHHLLQATAL